LRTARVTGMANFELNIDEARFARANVKVKFDENKYGQLLDHLVQTALTDSIAPTVHIRLHPAAKRYRVTSIAALVYGLGNLKDPSYQMGKYETATKDIIVKAIGDESYTNGILLHETNHWADDVNQVETEELHATDRRAQLPVRGLGVMIPLNAGLATGYAVAINEHANTMYGYIYAAGAGELAMMGLLAPIAMTLHKKYYVDKPREVRARSFAADPDIQAEYGHIISYEQI
jgi:hypothetical protein